MGVTEMGREIQHLKLYVYVILFLHCKISICSLADKTTLKFISSGGPLKIVILL